MEWSIRSLGARECFAQRLERQPDVTLMKNEVEKMLRRLDTFEAPAVDSPVDETGSRGERLETGVGHERGTAPK